MRALAVLRDAWSNRDKLGDSARTRELAAFYLQRLRYRKRRPTR